MRVLLKYKWMVSCRVMRKCLSPAETRTNEFMVMEDTINSFIQWPRNAIKILNTEALSAPAKAASHSSSSQSQTSSHTSTCDVYIPQVEVNQQIPCNLDSKLDDFVTSMIAAPGFCQLPKPQPLPMKPSKRKTTKELDQEKQVRKINGALEAIKTRPEKVQALAASLRILIGDETKADPIEWSTPLGMYPDIITEFIEYEALLQLFANGWVDITIISWFEMFYYKSSSSKANQCAFFGVNSITAHMCQIEPEVVEKHILDVYGIHGDKPFFLAPHLYNGHWSLFIISPKTNEVFILDSLKGQKNKNSYFLSKIIEDAFWDIKFTWRMVECKQQNNGWVCGYMVLIYMFQFVYGIQQDFPKLIWHDKSCVTQEEIDEFLVQMMPVFIKKMFEDRTG